MCDISVEGGLATTLGSMEACGACGVVGSALGEVKVIGNEKKKYLGRAIFLFSPFTIWIPGYNLDICSNIWQ